MEHVKEIITDKSKLEDWSIEIDPIKNHDLCSEIILSLKATMREHNLEYLTAPQIGYNRRIFCLRFGENNYRTFINPAVDNNTGITMSRESSASIPDKEYIIPRFSNIHFYFTTPLGKVESATLAGRAAFVFQQCLDHLNGLLIDDIGLEIDHLFDEATEEERNEVLMMYAESLDLHMKELQKEISEDAELKQIEEGIRFMNSVKEGSTILEPVKNKKEKGDE